MAAIPSLCCSPSRHRTAESYFPSRIHSLKMFCSKNETEYLSYWDVVRVCLTHLPANSDVG